MDRREFLKMLGIGCAAFSAPKPILPILDKLAKVEKPPLVYGFHRFVMDYDFDLQMFHFSAKDFNDDYMRFMRASQFKLWWPNRGPEPDGVVRMRDSYRIPKGTPVEAWFAPNPGSEKDWKPVELHLALQGIRHYHGELNQKMPYWTIGNMETLRLDRDRAVELGLAERGERDELEA